MDGKLTRMMTPRKIRQTQIIIRKKMRKYQQVKMVMMTGKTVRIDQKLVVFLIV
jgi:hypothetical protein